MKILNPATVMTPSAGYSQGIATGNTVYVAGQVSVDASGRPVGVGDIEAQTRQTLRNVALVLESDGLSLDNVVSTTVYLTDFANYAAFCKTWCEMFGQHNPTRATVRADLVHPALLVEVQAIAVRAAR